MIKLFSLAVATFFIVPLFAQQSSRTAVSADELVAASAGFFAEPKKEQIENALSKNQSIYLFEIVYKDQVIYREVIKKPVEGGGNELAAMGRLSYEIKFPYNTFDAEDLLSLLEDKLLETKKIGEYRYLETPKFDLLQNNYGETSVYSPLGKKGNIKLYRLDFIN